MKTVNPYSSEELVSSDISASNVLWQLTVDVVFQQSNLGYEVLDFGVSLTHFITFYFDSG